MSYQACQKDAREVDPTPIQPLRRRMPWTSRLLWPILTAAAVAASLFGAIASAGIWDPYELRVAELARRIAVNALAAPWLAINGADNSMVDLGDLQSGELPFTSIALGFRLFGLGEWSGRLPLACWGLLGVVATYLVVARLADEVAGAFAAVILATTPLYFVQVRTMLGDGVTMAAVAIAFSGLTIGAFDAVGRGRSNGRVRAVAVGFGVVGLVAGYLCRGPLYGVLIPAGAVALSWAIWRGNRRCSGDVFGSAVGVGCTVVALGALAIGAVFLHGAFDDPARFRLLVGAPLVQRHALLPFDHGIEELGYGLLPYSGILPLALGRLALPPTAPCAEAERESALRLALVVLMGLALAVSGVMTTWTQAVPFVAVSATAGIVAMAFRDLDRGAPVSAGLALGTVAFTILLALDLKVYRDQSFVAFGISGQKLPEGLADALSRWALIVAVGLATVAFVALSDRGGKDVPRFRRAEYLALPRALWSAQQGNLFFAALVVEAALVGAALLTWLSQEFFHWRQFANMSANARTAALAGWVAFPVLLLVVPAGGLFVRDVARELFARVSNRRARGTLLAFFAAALVMSLGYFPAMARQLSPRRVFVAFRERARDDEPLGLLGVGERSASYYARCPATVLSGAHQAFGWLSKGEQRRWLVMRSGFLPEINSLYRAAHPGRNLPVVDRQSSEILLAVSRLGPDDTNSNPLSDILLDGPVVSRRPIDANLGGKLEALGWEVAGADGETVDELVPGRTYQFVIYWKVVQRLTSEWETFIHIDGHGQRHNGDHETVGGRYPLRFWLPGDTIRDAYELTLEPNFAPGLYDVYFGLFIGSRRLQVQRGKHDDDRIFGGNIRVR